MDLRCLLLLLLLLAPPAPSEDESAFACLRVCMCVCEGKTVISNVYAKCYAPVDSRQEVGIGRHNNPNDFHPRLERNDCADDRLSSQRETHCYRTTGWLGSGSCNPWCLCGECWQ